MSFFTKHNPPPKVISPSGKVSLTESQYLNDCDINFVMRRCAAGDTTFVRTDKPLFADVSEVGDFARSMDKMLDARRTFEGLPAELRKRCGNDIRAFIDYVADPVNEDECIKYGLRVAPPKETPVKVEIVTDGKSKLDGLPTNT